MDPLYYIGEGSSIQWGGPVYVHAQVFVRLAGMHNVSYNICHAPARALGEVTATHVRS